MRPYMSKYIQRSRHVLYSCKFRVVFCPKYRRKVLVNGMNKGLKEIIYSVARELGCETLKLQEMLTMFTSFEKLTHNLECTSL
jgi:putative transposase